MGITVKIFKKDNQSLTEVIQKYTTQLSEKHTKLLADNTKNEFIKQVDETRIRTVKPSGLHIKDAIEVEKIEKGYGVGNINTLNKQAPWWAWINYGRAFSGREIPPGTDENPRIKGHFEPDQKGIFVKGKPRFAMNPKKPIPAHNYIEKGIAAILNIARINGLLK